MSGQSLQSAVSLPLGIDLGMTSSVIAIKGDVVLARSYPGCDARIYLPEVDVTVIPSPEGNLHFPSVLWLYPKNPDKYRVGDEAKQALERGESALQYPKRCIGTTQEFHLQERKLTAKDAAREILRYLKHCAEWALDRPITRTVVTHPAWFGPGQVAETKQAAEEVGFNMSLPEQTMMEPIAAALAYTISDPRDPLTVMVYDLGGGTFDISVLERRGGFIDCKAFAGNHLLGGYNFDRKLVQWVLDHLQAKGRAIPYDQNDPTCRSRRAKLLLIAEQVKIDLSKQHTDRAYIQFQAANVLVDDAGKPVRVLERISRADFAALIKDELDETIVSCRRALEKAGKKIEEIDELLLAGSSTHGPWVAEAIRNGLGKEPKPTFAPDLIVAVGAALHGFKIADIPKQTAYLELPAIELPGGSDIRKPATKEVFPKSPAAVGEEELEATKERLAALTEDEKIASVVLQRSATLSSCQMYITGHAKLLKATGDDISIPKVLGPYRIIDTLGRGAFTVVCLAEDNTSFIGHRVALKIPTRQRLDETWVNQLKHEAKVWRLLTEKRNANILSLEDLKQVAPFTFFVTEYMDGGDLADAMGKLQRSERVQAVVDVLEPLCEGLAFAHRERVVHGDIKPQNILVSADLKNVKLGDFGLSFLSETISGHWAASKVVGTIPFLAPECFDGIKSPQTDIWALGITLIHLLTEEFPFEISSARQSRDLLQDRSLDIKALKEERMAYRPRLREDCPGIPDWLEEAIHRCVAPQPEQRFRDAGELLEFILPFINPDKAQRVVLTTWWNPESQIVDYDLEVREERNTELLTQEVTHELIKGLGKQWNKLGELSLRLARARRDRQSPGEVEREIQDLLRIIADDGGHFVLGSKVCQLLGGHSRTTLLLILDPRLGEIPWELLGVGSLQMCRRFAISRIPRTRQRPSSRKPLTDQEPLRVLLVADPTGDLEGAQEECRRLEQEFSRNPLAGHLEVELMDSSTDTFTLRSRMRRCHVLHFAGHAVLANNPNDLSQQGWLLRHGDRAPDSDDILRASALGSFWLDEAPLLVFANACSSGRTGYDVLRSPVFSDAALGLAQAFLAAGVTNYIGTVWDPPDNQTTIEFACAFYREFLVGRTVSQAVLAARNTCAEHFREPDLTWARYVLFGDPFTRLDFAHGKSVV